MHYALIALEFRSMQKKYLKAFCPPLRASCSNKEGPQDRPGHQSLHNADGLYDGYCKNQEWYHYHPEKKEECYPYHPQLCCLVIFHPTTSTKTIAFSAMPLVLLVAVTRKVPKTVLDTRVSIMLMASMMATGRRKNDITTLRRRKNLTLTTPISAVWWFSIQQHQPKQQHLAFSAAVVYETQKRRQLWRD